jgi:hypothetical protein
MRPDGYPAAVMSTTILMSSGRFWSAAGQFRTAQTSGDQPCEPVRALGDQVHDVRIEAALAGEQGREETDRPGAGDQRDSRFEPGACSYA